MKQFNFHEAKSVKEAVKAATKKSAFLDSSIILTATSPGIDDVSTSALNNLNSLDTL